MHKLSLYEKTNGQKKGTTTKMRYRNKIGSAVALLLVAAAVMASPIGATDTQNTQKRYVTLGGMPFGVSFSVGELIIKGFDDIETKSGVCSPARDAGMLCGDTIKAVNKKEPACALDVTVAVRGCKGEKMEFLIERDGAQITVNVTPVLSEETGEYRIGLWLDDSTAGLGTVTYIEEGTKRFGGLGHGICDTATGELSKLGKGVVSQVEITGVTKGTPGEPGELRGDFLPVRLGSVLKNTDVGVFGLLTKLPEGTKGTRIEIGSSSEIKNGGASIFCTTDNGGVCEYGVEVTRLDDSSEGGKNFLITVTDTALIKKTGGIVRGMSGSPVVQNGKLVGAVTHVLISDPCRGYGIFIENMIQEVK